MGYATIRYRVKTEKRQENRALIEAVFEELGQSAPQGLRYLVFELDDGEFLHIVEEAGDASPLPRLTAFQAFTRDHAARRDGPVSRHAASLVGNYRMLSGQGEA